MLCCSCAADAADTTAAAHDDPATATFSRYVQRTAMMIAGGLFLIFGHTQGPKQNNDALFFFPSPVRWCFDTQLLKH